MKVLAVFFALFVLSSSEGNKFFMIEKFAESRDKCLEENSLTLDDLQSGWRPGEETENQLCFHRCLMVKEGMIDENFVVQEDKVPDIIQAPHLSEEERNAVVECVKAIGKFEECEDIRKMFECFPFKKRG